MTLVFSAPYKCSYLLTYNQLQSYKFAMLRCATSRRQHQLPATASLIGSDSISPVPCSRDVGIYTLTTIFSYGHTFSKRFHAHLLLLSAKFVRRQLRPYTFQTALVHSAWTTATVCWFIWLVSPPQNAARLIFHSRRSAHILTSLHWLRVQVLGIRLQS